MGKVSKAKIVHTADDAKELILNFWMPKNQIDAKNERKLRKALATFSRLRLERVMNDAGMNAEIRRLLALEMELLSSDVRPMRDLTHTKTVHTADPRKEAILNFWMPDGIINDQNEKKLRKSLASFSTQRLEMIMNGTGKNNKTRSELAKKAGLLR